MKKQVQDWQEKIASGEGLGDTKGESDTKAKGDHGKGKEKQSLTELAKNKQ